MLPYFMILMNTLLDRSYRFEYTNYEFNRIKELYDCKLNYSECISGYIDMLDGYYILTPTNTVFEPYIVCRSDLNIPKAMVRVDGRWILDDSYPIFKIYAYDIINTDIDDIMDGVIDYDEYVRLLFNNSMIDDIIKHMMAYMLLIDHKYIKARLKVNNANMLMKRINNILKVFDVDKLFIKELRRYRIIRMFDNVEFINGKAMDINLTLDDPYIDPKVDPYDLYEIIKFMVSISMVNIDTSVVNGYAKHIMLNSNTLNHANTILALSIVDAKVNKQSRLEDYNIKYAIDLLSMVNNAIEL